MKTSFSMLLSIIFASLFALVLCSCGSKSNQTFTPEGSKLPEESHASSFTSTDGSVTFQFQLDELKLPKSMPIVDVVPHYLTEEDARIVAQTLFGDQAQYYEARLYANRIYSRNELLDQISRWSHYTSEDAVEMLYGSNQEKTTEKVKKAIERNTLLLENAPEEDTRIPTQWQFHKESFYYLSQEDYQTQDTSMDNDEIMLEVICCDLPYIYTAAKRDMNDFKLNYLSAHLDEGAAPRQLDLRILRAQLCRTEKPGDSALAAAQQKAELLLKNMNLGNWQIDTCYVEEVSYETASEYIIHVGAVPVFAETPACRHLQLENLKSKEIYASNYYITDVNFEFSPNGDLLSFELRSPVDEANATNSDVPLLGRDALLERAKEVLCLSDIFNYDPLGISQKDNSVLCSISVSKTVCGLSRINVADMEQCYRYVPSVVFYGTVYIQDRNKEMTFFINDNVPLLTLNAQDGSIIQFS